MTKPSDIRFTPESVLDVVREFNDIVLDPCTEAHNPTRALIGLCLSQGKCGLKTCWSGLLADEVPGHEPFAFVNPPYSSGQLIQWAAKAIEEWERNWVESIMLVPADTSTRATQLLLERCNAVAFWKKRICFSGEQGAKFANALFYCGERQGRFKRVFEEYATVIVLR
jgi:hypothetical protein